MKRIIPVLLIFVFLFSGCGRTRGDDFTVDSVFKAPVSSSQESTENESTKENTTRLKIENYVSEEEQSETTTLPLPTDAHGNETFVASWLSYLELSVKEGRDTKEKYAEYISGIFDNMLQVKVTDVFVQVRPFADAFYSSVLFPVSAYVSSEQGGSMPFDVLEVIIETAKTKNINIHAWINPYRVSRTPDLQELSGNNPARVWYEEGSNEDVVVRDNGIYFNPSSQKVKNLIIDGVREILHNYDVKGIHIDDYFYFDNCGDFDAVQYNEYLSSGGQLSLENWRRENVSSLLSFLYIAVKSYSAEKMFSVSPGGNIDKCYNENYADVYLWCRNEGYCDMIIPQIYFGFENEKLPFEECLSQWVGLCEGSSVDLAVGLALYKSGQQDTYALSGKDEWIENSDIISRQVQCIKEKNCYGFALYSGSYIDFSEKNLSKELNNLKTVAY